VVLILAEFCIVYADENLIFMISHDATSGSLRDCEKGLEERCIHALPAHSEKATAIQMSWR
jgi:hypothetical protein